MTKKKEGAKIGRPPQVGGETPARQLGRVSDEEWAEIREACEAAKMSLVQWALPTLLAKARREKVKRLN